MAPFRPIYLMQISKRGTAVPQIEWERTRNFRWGLIRLRFVT